MTNVTRRYEPETLILETIFETATGSVSVCDFMPPNDGHSMIHRIVEGQVGTVEMQMELIVRYEYGAITLWATATGDGLVLVAARDGLRLHSPVRLVGKDNTTVATFSVSGDNRRSFSLTWFPSEIHAPLPLDSLAARNHTRHYWHDWVGRCTYNGGWRDLVVRSLITLKALTYEPSGAVCAAATTSLPETIGGNRNWDYRYSWLRDATFTLQALLVSGYTDEAAAWVGWLRRAVAGNPGEMQIMYGVDGERRLAEFELDHLAGYEGSTPVRIGNKAVTQLQLDVYGEVLDSAVTYWRSPIPKESNVSPDLLMAILDHLEKMWRQPDNGIWEVRGPRRHFTHSKVMAWVAFDRAVTLAEDGVLPKEPMDHWRQVRDEIHAEVCEKGFDPELNSFTQYYGSKLLDASLLMLAPVGFLPPDDPRVVGTVEAIQKGLVTDGFVRRYQTDTDEDVDGLKGNRGRLLDDELLARRQPRVARTPRRGKGDVRAALCALQRRRSPLRRVRPEGRSAARELPAGLLARGPDQHRRQPLDGRARPLGDAQSPSRPAPTSKRSSRLINQAKPYASVFLNSSLSKSTLESTGTPFSQAAGVPWGSSAW